MDENDKIAKAKAAHGWLVSWLTGRGVPAALARVLGGAVVGAVCAWIAATQVSCSVSPEQVDDLRRIDAFLHEYGYLLIDVDDSEK